MLDTLTALPFPCTDPPREKIMTQPYPPATPPTPPGPPMPIGHLSYPHRSGLLRGFLIGCVALGALLIAFALGVGVGASTDATPPTAASEVPASAPAVSFPAEPAPVTVAPPAATVAPPAVPTAPVGDYPPAAAFDNGAWKVGDEVAAGTYRSAGPTDGVVKLCYVDTKVDDKIVSQEVSNEGPVRITVADGQTVKASGCQQFTKVG